MDSIYSVGYYKCCPFCVMDYFKFFAIGSYKSNTQCSSAAKCLQFKQLVQSSPTQFDNSLVVVFVYALHFFATASYSFLELLMFIAPLCVK